VTGLGAQVRLEDLEHDPYPVLARLRREEPVAWAPALDRWLVSSRELFLEVVMRPGDFTTDSVRSPIKRVFDAQMLSSDGDEQQRHRAPFSPPFRLRAVRDRASESIDQTVASLLDRVEESGSPVDLGPLASELAVRTVVDMLGVLVDDVGRVRRWYDDFAAGLANVQGDAAVFDRARVTAARCREEMVTSTAPGSLLDELVRAADAGGLGIHDVLSNTLLILFGGVETTESVILNAGWALLTEPEQLASVRADPDVLANAIEESMRWEPAVQTVTRFALRDVDLAGARINAGDVVDCMIGGANRDPAHFDEPDRFDAARANATDHVTFGHGRHRCLGLHLARLEAVTFWRALLDRRPALALARCDPPVGHEFRKPPALWIAP